ncbi:MAG: potassium/proton antiporter [Rikenellaceae bacterium]|nr:potassium/proton antiporter [Rikenellaceae bacterium]
MIEISSENFVLVGAVLLFVAVMAGKVAYRFGAPSLLLFLGVGMLFSGLGFISFNSFEMTQFIGMIALCIILFTGGMETKYSQIRPVVAPGVVLATVGVLLTALIVALFIWLIAPIWGRHLAFPVAMLMASTMASTDSASVFSILRTKKQGLQQNLRPLLELESGSNDPVAYMLTILLTGMVTQGESTSIPGALVMFLVQMVVGVICGYLIGRAAVWVINRMKFSNKALYPVLLLAFAFFSFAFTSLLRGNGYLAVYLSGLVVGNMRLDNKHEMVNFFDGFQSLWQIVMFLTLGLLVNPKELLQPDLLIMGSLVALFMIFVARPAAVFLSMAPFRKFTTKARLYISWVGLRGAVPIIFATYPMLAGAPEHQARLLFNIVFLVTIISLLVQGTTVSGMANLLGLAYEERESPFKVNLHDSITSVLSEVEVNRSMLLKGETLKEISLPDNTLVMMVCRDGDYFVPQGKTRLLLGDKLLLISDRHEELQSAYRDLGVEFDIKQ